ncbi:hypothetical protein FRB94_008671 [Tulasnella sp. JGI-2019a]|nr:hypothetical protein FRB93_012231 [Tulasnella sp. JGI-2019a]KAG9011387.1 hypothetical protein FRB94_008671 [Tulasnella sp. JGI-2019a]KAG9035478.1 hypothetical protein FRB95_011184 [Tulasnella sp. JGI-2019a]
MFSKGSWTILWPSLVGLSVTGGLGLLLAVLFLVIALPEVSKAELQAEANDLADDHGEVENPQLAKPFIRQYRPIFGFIYQFMYVGSQVTIGRFFINYVIENASYTSAEAKLPTFSFTH